MKRRFFDAHPDIRCTAIVTLSDKTTANCGRKRVIGDLCKQHAKITIPFPKQGDECFKFLLLEFNVTEALKIVQGREVTDWIEPSKLSNGMIMIDEEYAMSNACNPDTPGIMIQVPALGTLLIDGNHRAFKAVKEKRERFYVYLLSEEESKHVCYTRDIWKHLVRKSLRERK